MNYIFTTPFLKKKSRLKGIFLNYQKDICFYILLLLMFVVTACQNESYDQDYQNELSKISCNGNINSNANLLEYYLSKDEEKLKELCYILGNNTPRYDMLSLRLNSTFGFTFVIPYTDETEEIKGAIYFPIAEVISENGKKVMTGDKLRNPVDINASNLEEKLPIEQRFLYSNYFNSLKKDGEKVDERLCDYLKMSICPIRITKSELQTLNSRVSGRYSSSCKTLDNLKPISVQASSNSTDDYPIYYVNFMIYYDCKYEGYVAPGEVVEVSERTLSLMLKDAERGSNCKIEKYTIDFNSRSIGVNAAFTHVYCDLDYSISCFVSYFFSKGINYNWDFCGSYVYDKYGVIVICGPPDKPGEVGYLLDGNGIYKKDTIVNGKKIVMVDFVKSQIHVLTKMDKKINKVSKVERGQRQKFPTTCFIKGLNVAENLITGSNKDYETKLLLAYAKRSRSNSSWLSLAISTGIQFSDINELLNLTFNADSAQNADVYNTNCDFSEERLNGYLNSDNIVLTDVCTSFDANNNLLESHNVVIFGYSSDGGYLVYDTIKGQVIVLQPSDILGSYAVVIKNSNVNAFNKLIQ